MREVRSLFKPAGEEEGGRRIPILPKALIWCLILSLYVIAVWRVGWGWAILIVLALTTAGATLDKGRRSRQVL